MINMTYGVYHKNNAAKFRIMLCCWRHGAVTGCEPALSPREMEAHTGIPAKNISRLMNHYRKIGAHYFRRLKMRNGENFYRYRLTETGVHYLSKYMRRYLLGLSLNCSTRRHKLQYMPHFTEMRRLNISTKELDADLDPNIMKYYVGVTKQGALDLGIEQEDVINIIKLMKV